MLSGDPAGALLTGVAVGVREFLSQRGRGSRSCESRDQGNSKDKVLHQ
jgi:hypothetical protein